MFQIPESSQISNPTETASAEKNQNTESVNFKDSEDQDFATHFRWLFRLPTVGIALAALGIFVGSQLTHFQTTPDSENINTSANLAMNASVQIQRDRPQQVSLFSYRNLHLMCQYITPKYIRLKFNYYTLSYKRYKESSL